MLNRSAVYALLMLQKRGNGIFAPRKDGRIPLTKEIIQNISDMVDTTSQIHPLLVHVVNGRKETRNAAVDPNNPINDFAAIKKLLDADYSLLFQAADVVTPSGLTVKRTTPYEAALGSGDPVMAEFIAGYLNKSEAGRAEKARSDERYRPHIENMMTTPPYDVNWLVDIMIAASDEDVAAVLNKTPGHQSALKDAIERYQRETMPGVITVGMHCNYNNLKHIFDVYDEKFDELKSTNPHADEATKYSRHKLFSRRVIGWEQGNLTAFERFVFARGSTSPDRTYQWRHADGSFPVSLGASRSGLGDEYWAGGAAGPTSGGCGRAMCGSAFYKPCVEQKRRSWANYAARIEPQEFARVLSNSVR